MAKEKRKKRAAPRRQRRGGPEESSMPPNLGEVPPKQWPREQARGKSSKASSLKREKKRKVGENFDSLSFFCRKAKTKERLPSEMLAWHGGARAKLVAQQQKQQQQNEFPILGAKRVGFRDNNNGGGGESGDDDDNDGENGNEGGKRAKFDTLMGFPLPPPRIEAAREGGRGEELIPSAKAASAGVGDKGASDDPMISDAGDPAADDVASSLDKAEAEDDGEDTPANEARMEQGSGGGDGTAAAAAAAAANSAPLAPEHRRRRHIFVLRGRSRGGPVRNLDLEAIDF